MDASLTLILGLVVGLLLGAVVGGLVVRARTRGSEVDASPAVLEARHAAAVASEDTFTNQAVVRYTQLTANRRAAVRAATGH